MSRLLLGFIVLLCSCKSIYRSVNGINKETEFLNIEQYFNYVNKKTNINLENFYTVSNKDFQKLLNDVVNKNISFYYGIIEDEKLIISGSNLKDKKSCYGSIKENINGSIIGSESTTKDKETILTELEFTNPYNKKLNLKNNKKIVVFIYSYKLGRLADNITDIIDETNNSLSNIIISIDNLDFKTKTLN